MGRSIGKLLLCVIRCCFSGKDYREIPLVSQGEKNHRREEPQHAVSDGIEVQRSFMNLDWSEIEALMSLNLLEIDAIYA